MTSLRERPLRRGTERSASATAVAASSTARTPATGVPPRSSSHVATPKTGFPARRAKPISVSVPHPPPIATTASAAPATSALRASPSPVGSASTTQPFASSRSLPGRIPTVMPPRDRAPRQAASITPPSPPQISVAPAAAIAAPASSASASSAADASAPVPTTAMQPTRRGTRAPSRGRRS